MTRALQALTAEPWAIEPSWLPFLAAMAGREKVAAPADATWAGRAVDLYAGPNGRRMEGSQSAVITGDGVALIPMFGPIFPRANMMTDVSGCTTAQAIGGDIQLALANPEVGAIMLMIDSPGGQVSGIAALADAIYAARRQKMLVAHAVGNIASAAYWTGSQATQLSIDRTGAAGSIGVAAALGKQVQPDSEGEMSFDIVSSNAPNKLIDPEDEASRQQLIGMLDAIETQFIGDVARGRATTPTRVKADFGQGGVFVGQAAVDAGLVDQVSTFDAVYRGVAKQVSANRKVQQLKP